MGRLDLSKSVLFWKVKHLSNQGAECSPLLHIFKGVIAKLHKKELFIFLLLVAN